MKSLRILPFTAPMALFILFSCGAPSEKGAAVDTQTAGPAEITDMTGVTTYWECPMKCENKKYSEPGHCPICHMELVERHVGETGGDMQMHEGHMHDEGGMEGAMPADTMPEEGHTDQGEGT